MPGVSLTGKIIYAAVTLMLCELFRSILGTSGISMLPYIARTDADRSKFVAFSNTCAIVAYLIIGTFMLPLAKLFGGGELNRGYAPTLLTFAIIAFPLNMCAYFYLTEKNVIISETKPPLSQIYSVILKKRRLLIYYIGYCLYYMADAFRSVTTYYYMTYNLGRPDLLPVVIMAGLLSPIAMQPIIPKLLKFATKETLIAVGNIGASAAVFTMLAFADNPYALIVYAVIYGLFASIFGNLNFAVMASFSDELQTRNNLQMSEILSATMTLFYKLGIAVASGAAPLVMALTGYSALAPVQNAGALTGFKMLYIICNASLLAVSGIILIFVGKGARDAGIQDTESVDTGAAGGTGAPAAEAAVINEPADKI
jgi:GPH family glycoside/pentoside/hexuronide:cation symporter